MPIVVVSPTISAEDPPYAPRSPSPGEYTHYRENGRGFDVGRDIRVTAPPNHDHTWDANPPAPSAPVSPSEFWDNITIPYSAYFPAPRDGSPEHRTLPQPQPTRSTEEHPMSGINLPRSISTHSSLYQQSRNLSPAPQPSQLPRATTGRMSSSSVHRFDPDVTKDVGNESTGSSGQSHNLHQSYSCPLSHDTMRLV